MAQITYDIAAQFLGKNYAPDEFSGAPKILTFFGAFPNENH